MTKADRLKTFMMHFDLSQESLAQQIGTSQTAISAMCNGSREISAKTIFKIEKQFPQLYSGWLLTGEGEMLKPSAPELESNAEMLGRPFKATTLDEGVVQVRFFNVSPSATFDTFKEQMSEEPEMIGIIPPAGTHIDENWYVFRIHGESMAPQIQDRAKVLSKEIPASKWHTLRDCIVIMAYDNRFVIKRIVKNKLDAENYLILESDNPDVPGPRREKVSLSGIRCVFLAHSIISQRLY